MHIEVTTDASIQGNEALIRHVEIEATRMLRHFSNHIMSVDVHFTDEKGNQQGKADKRCLIEARCSGRPPIAASDEDATVEASFHGALKKLQRLLESSLGKATAHKGGETIRKENFVENEEMSAERL